VTNCIFVPTIGFGVIPLGLCAVFLQPLSSFLAGGILRCCAFLLEGLLDGVQLFANLPFAAVKTVTPSFIEMGCYYSLCWAFLQALKTHTDQQESGSSGRNQSPQTAKRIAILALVVFSVDVGYWTFQRYFLADLRVTIVDVGQGASALLELPGGSTMLIDGGGFSDLSTFDVGAGVVAPFLWRKKIRTVDTVVLSHPNSDHLNGLLFILDHFNVTRVWANGEPSRTDGYKRFLRAVRDNNIRMQPFPRLPREQRLNGVHVKILYPPKYFLCRKEREAWRNINNNSIVIKAKFGSVSFLFTGDITATAEYELVRMAGDSLTSTVLVAPHHGSRTSSTPALLNRVAPEVVAVSSGANNRYGFPHPDVVERFLERNCRILRTDRQGAVRFRTDGKNLDVRTEVNDAGWQNVKR
jgi:competence protein ComEC